MISFLPWRKPIFFSLLFFAFIAITIIISGCGTPQILSSLLSGKSEPESRQTELAPGQLVTLDGYDPETGVLVLRISLRKDLNSPPSGVITTLNHGESVKFIRREGDGVLVETKDDKRGWVASFFVREFK